MPRGDGTGPNGMGPMTGRGFGRGAGSQMPGGMNAGQGQGMGRGGRGGFGGMNMGAAPGADYVPRPAETMPQDMPVQTAGESDIDLLRREVASLSQALSDIAVRIGTLEQKKALENPVETPAVNDGVESEE